MKLLTEKEIEEIVKNIANKNDLVCIIPVSGSGRGISCHEYTLCDHEVIELIQNSMQEVQKLLLKSASEGFEEWSKKQCHTECLDREDLEFVENDKGEQFISLNEVDRLIESITETTWQAAKLSSAKEMQEKDAEIEELKYYKEQWQDIAGKANLKNLVATVEKLEKENEELKQELLLSKPLYSQRKLEERIKEAEEIIVSWNEYLKRENELASKIGTVADDYIAKWNLPENTDSSKGKVK